MARTNARIDALKDEVNLWSKLRNEARNRQNAARFDELGSKIDKNLRKIQAIKDYSKSRRGKSGRGGGGGVGGGSTGGSP